MVIRKFVGLEDELHETAACKTGFDDFGDIVYREGLRVLLHSIDIDLQLTEPGWQRMYDSVLWMLIARLWAQRGWTDHPEVLRVPIRRPLVITGFPRTGTTALHKLLSVDPQFQGLNHWLMGTPMIRPPKEAWDTHPAFRTSAASLEAEYAAIPDLRKAHNIAAREVDECGWILMQSFVTIIFNNVLPTYGRWVVAQSRRRSYQRYVDVLRLIGAHEPDKRWLLKDPKHLFEIEALFQVFPDACIVHTHRDPLASIPSFCNLSYMVQQQLEGEAASTDIGPRECTFWRKALDHAAAAREKFPQSFFDVDHRRFVADPIGVVRSIYDNFGFTLSPETEQQMHAWIAAIPASRHSEHRYAIDRWGITSAQICDVFADYRKDHQFI